MGDVGSKVQDYSLKVGEWVDFGGDRFLTAPDVRLIYGGMAGKEAFSVIVLANSGVTSVVAYPLFYPFYPVTQRDISSAVSGYKLEYVKRITVLSVDGLVLRLQVEKP